jgi:hypothetical protein
MTTVQTTDKQNYEDICRITDPISIEIQKKIEHLNATLPNIHKWAICNKRLVDYMLIYRRDKAGLPKYGEKYNPSKTYYIQCSPLDLRQIGFLTDYIEFHYMPIEAVEQCIVRKDPISVCPLEFRSIELHLKIARYSFNECMRQFTTNITPENVCLAMLISSKFTYQWEPESYHGHPPVYFRFLAKRIYKPEQDAVNLFRQLIVNRYTDIEML